MVLNIKTKIIEKTEYAREIRMRRAVMRSENEKRSLFIGFYNPSVVLTYIGLASTVFGITCVFNRHIAAAFICLLISGTCDMFDGKIARAMNRTEDEQLFGIQIDSLCDLVCFGVYPAIIGYSFGVNHGLGILSAYMIIQAAVIRLGFFNVTEQQRQQNTAEPRKCYQGLPVTTVAMLLPLLYLGRHNIPGNIFPFVFQGFMILVSLLFILNINIKKLSATRIVVLFTIGALLVLGTLKAKG